MKLKLPHSSQNWITLIGAMISVISLFMIIFLFTITILIENRATYLGLIVYIILPSLMVIGLILIPLGMWIKNLKDKRTEIVRLDKWPEINLNNVRHRNAFIIFSFGTIIFLFLTAIGSYQAFHFTESVEFCGKLCHEVMKPEFTAYQNSPHAKVACVECHVGSGADWYVRSKLSGMYQVYAVTTDSYPTPIPTPISNLRPARETCEECHWPQKFYSRIMRVKKHFLPDETNTEWDIYLMLKIGAENSALGLSEGIHWHINPNVKIEYFADDSLRESIPWVRYTNSETGETKVFVDEESDFDMENIESMPLREVDCMDCHNRPSHDYKPPAFFVNNALAAKSIPKELPEIKSLAMDICSEEFPSTDSAMTYIEQTVNEFYEDDYPEINNELVQKGISGLQDAFKKNIFPEMKVRWDAYPNQIGHVEFIGCFRCHNDTHSTEEGEVISRDCNLCHSITAQGPTDDLQITNVKDGMEFKHPVDIEEEWKEMLCVDCHTGLNP